MHPTASVSNAPVTISRARSGALAQIFPNSDTCRNCSVLLRIDWPALTTLPLPNSISVVFRRFKPTAARSDFGSRSYGLRILFLNRLVTSSSVCAIRPAVKLGVKSAWSSAIKPISVENPIWRALRMRFQVQSAWNNSCCSSFIRNGMASPLSLTIV